MSSRAEQREASEQRLLIVRGSAIELYALVERALCQMLSHLSDTTIQVASITFFRIGAHPRNIILDELMSNKYGRKYKEYWDSIMSMIRHLDQKRNQIVHWHTHINLTDTTAEIALSRPATWHSGKEISEMSITEIEEFIRKCDFVQRSLHMFWNCLEDKFPQSSPTYAAWHGIFLQQAVYPPPDNHPLSRKRIKSPVPPRSSQA